MNMGERERERELGHPAEALVHFEAALEAKSGGFGPDSEGLLELRADVGGLLLELGELERAQTELGAVLAADEAGIEVETHALVRALEGLARIDLAAAQPDAAAAKRARIAQLGAKSEP